MLCQRLTGCEAPLFAGLGASSIGGLILLGDLRNEVPHLPDGGLRLFFIGGIDLVPDLLSGRFHRFELINRHKYSNVSNVS